MPDVYHTPRMIYSLNYEKFIKDLANVDLIWRKSFLLQRQFSQMKTHQLKRIEQFLSLKENIQSPVRKDMLLDYAKELKGVQMTSLDIETFKKYVEKGD